MRFRIGMDPEERDAVALGLAHQFERSRMREGMTEPTSPVPDQPPRLRERKKQDKRTRILQAAARLFAEHGYESVTTPQIAQEAGVGQGTLYRHVGSKARLLAMVMNDRVRQGIENGLHLARHGATPIEAILAMLAPVAEESVAHPENSIAYQREALFGAEPHRAEAATQVAQIESAIATVLAMYTERVGCRDVQVSEAAHAIYSTVYMDLVRVSVGHADITSLPARVRQTVQYLVAELVDHPRRATS